MADEDDTAMEADDVPLYEPFECPICLCSWTKEFPATTKMDNCPHSFCTTCIQKWYKDGPNTNCPVCRTPSGVQVDYRNSTYNDPFYYEEEEEEEETEFDIAKQEYEQSLRELQAIFQQATAATNEELDRLEDRNKEIAGYALLSFSEFDIFNITDSQQYFIDNADDEVHVVTERNARHIKWMREIRAAGKPDMTQLDMYKAIADVYVQKQLDLRTHITDKLSIVELEFYRHQCLALTGDFNNLLPSSTGMDTYGTGIRVLELRLRSFEDGTRNLIMRRLRDRREELQRDQQTRFSLGDDFAAETHSERFIMPMLVADTPPMNIEHTWNRDYINQQFDRLVEQVARLTEIEQATADVDRSRGVQHYHPRESGFAHPTTPWSEVRLEADRQRQQQRERDIRATAIRLIRQRQEEEDDDVSSVPAEPTPPVAPLAFHAAPVTSSRRQYLEEGLAQFQRLVRQHTESHPEPVHYRLLGRMMQIPGIFRHRNRSMGIETMPATFPELYNGTDDQPQQGYAVYATEADLFGARSGTPLVDVFVEKPLFSLHGFQWAWKKFVQCYIVDHRSIRKSLYSEQEIKMMLFALQLYLSWQRLRTKAIESTTNISINNKTDILACVSHMFPGYYTHPH